MEETTVRFITQVPVVGGALEERCKFPGRIATKLVLTATGMKAEDIGREFLELLNRYQPVIHKVCRIYADSREDREDLFQETVYQLWRSYPSFRAESTFGTWLYRVALNTAINALRRKTKRPEHMPFTDDLQQGHPPSLTGGEAERIDLLYRAVRRLNQIDRALVLLYLDDLSYGEISNILGLSESNIGVRLNRIKTKLQSIAKELE